MYMLNFEKQFPNIDEKTEAKEACKILSNYVYQVMRYLRWALDNIDESNMNTSFVEKLTNDISESVSDKVSGDVDSKVQQITNNYFNTVQAKNVITNMLNAAYGNVANLTVDKLRTDYKRAQNYIKGDTSDLNYIYIHDEQIEFITAVVSGTEGILFTSDGKQLYWTDSTHTALTFEATTTQVINNQQITTQNEKVYVYPYTEYNKGHIQFESVISAGVETVQPVFTLGTGDSNGNGKAYLLKGADCLELTYISRTDGAKYGIKIYDTGLMQTANGKDYIIPIFKEYATLADMQNDNDLPVGAYGLIGGGT